MPIYGVSYHKLVQTGYFQSETPLDLKQLVVVSLDQGQVLARVVSGPHESLETGEDAEPLSVILRPATEEDLAQDQANTELAVQAGAFWKDKVRERGLDMKLIEVEVFLDRSKIIFYFTSMSRIDFRELVKDVVHMYRVRIEFRQIGVRHETQMIGAVGNCGMVCCCRRYLHQFAPVTIRMAKEQNLFLNPSKVSGMCGRLLCCLAYEQESYEKFHNESPRLGKRYVTADGQFKVIRTNLFHNSVTCLSENSEEVKFSLDEWNALEPKRVDGNAVQARETEHQAESGPADGEGADTRESRDSREGKPRTEERVGQSGQERKARGGKGAEKRQTFVTGRMSFRQQARNRSQLAAKKREETARPEAAPSQGRSRPPQGQGRGRPPARADTKTEAKADSKSDAERQKTPRRGQEGPAADRQENQQA